MVNDMTNIGQVYLPFWNVNQVANDGIFKNFKISFNVFRLIS